MAGSKQSNWVDQDASNRNSANALDVNAQEQKAVQVGAGQSNRNSNYQDVSAKASTPAIGGTTLAVGPLRQSAAIRRLGNSMRPLGARISL